VLAHDPEHASHRGADTALVPKPCPDLGVTISDEDWRGEHSADLREDRLVGGEGLQAAFRGDLQLGVRQSLVALDGGAGKAPRLMLTGGWSALRPELETVGAVLRKRALSFGVPDSDIIVVGRASNTEEEARAVREHFAVNPIMDADTGQPRAPRIILVTSAFHMTRAESLSRAAGLDVTPFPVDFRGPTRITLRSFIPSGLALAQTELALHEIYGCVYYWLRGLVVGSSIWCTPHRRRFGHTRSRRSTRVRARHRHRTRHRTPRHHLGERALFLPAVHVGG